MFTNMFFDERDVQNTAQGTYSYDGDFQTLITDAASGAVSGDGNICAFLEIGTLNLWVYKKTGGTWAQEDLITFASTATTIRLDYTGANIAIGGGNTVQIFNSNDGLSTWSLWDSFIPNAGISAGVGFISKDASRLVLYTTSVGTAASIWVRGASAYTLDNTLPVSSDGLVVTDASDDCNVIVGYDVTSIKAYHYDGSWTEKNVATMTGSGSLWVCTTFSGDVLSYSNDNTGADGTAYIYEYGGATWTLRDSLLITGNVSKFIAMVRDGTEVYTFSVGSTVGGGIIYHYQKQPDDSYNLETVFNNPIATEIMNDSQVPSVLCSHRGNSVVAFSEFTDHHIIGWSRDTIPSYPEIPV